MKTSPPPPKTNTFNLFEKRLGHIHQTLKTASKNIVNRQTRGYQSQTVAPFSQTVRGLHLPLRVTHEGHVSSTPGRSLYPTQPCLRNQRSLADNNADLKEDLMTINQANLDHNQITTMYRAYAEIVESALIK